MFRRVHLLLLQVLSAPWQRKQLLQWHLGVGSVHLGHEDGYITKLRGERQALEDEGNTTSKYCSHIRARAALPLLWPVGRRHKEESPGPPGHCRKRLLNESLAPHFATNLTCHFIEAILVKYIFPVSTCPLKSCKNAQNKNINTAPRHSNGLEFLVSFRDGLVYGRPLCTQTQVEARVLNIATCQKNQAYHLQFLLTSTTRLPASLTHTTSSVDHVLPEKILPSSVSRADPTRSWL